MGCFNEKTFSFDKWWQRFSEKKRFLLKPNILNFNFDQLRYMIASFETQFLQDIWQTRTIEGYRSFNNKIFALPRTFIVNFYKSRAQFFKSLKAT